MPDQVPPPSPSSRPRADVLIVDDSTFARSLLGAVFRAEGCEVRLASDGREAVDVYRQHQRDVGLVVLDLRMPGLSGVATLEALQGIDPDVRCCFVSGHTNGEDAEAEQLKKRGAVAVVPKPFTLDRIKDLIRGLRA